MCAGAFKISMETITRNNDDLLFILEGLVKKNKPNNTCVLGCILSYCTKSSQKSSNAQLSGRRERGVYVGLVLPTCT